MFVTVDGEDIARKVFRRTQNSMKCEGRERKIKGLIKKIRIILYLSEIFHRKI
jgi:hypothetical protein